LPSPFRFIDTIPTKEKLLKIKQFSLNNILAFDLGSTWLETEIDPKAVTELLVQKGYAVANECPALGISGGTLYLARKLTLLDKGQTRLLRKSKIGHDEWTKFNDSISKKIKSLSKAEPKKVKDAWNSFTELIGLLEEYAKWDEQQLPQYVESCRFCRTIFNPILLKFSDVEEHLKSFRPIQVVISIHSSGVACLNLWLYPANPDRALDVRRLQKLLACPWEIEVAVAFPLEISSIVEEAINHSERAGYGLGLKRKKELDCEANANNVGARYGISYLCWEGTLQGVAWIFFFLVYKTCLESMQKHICVQNLEKLWENGYFSYAVLNLPEVVGIDTLKRPFEEVVAKYPRQIFGLLAVDEEFNFYTEETLRHTLVDISAISDVSGVFSLGVMLKVVSTDNWKAIKKNNETNVLWIPSFGDIGDVALFEILCQLRLLLDGYNSHLLKLVKVRPDIRKLSEAEKKITCSLEEIYEARHAVFGGVRHWWWLAEERLRIEELLRALRERLNDTHRAMTTKRQEEQSRFQVLLTILFGFLGVASVWEVLWEIGEAFNWSAECRMGWMFGTASAIFLLLISILAWYQHTGS